MAAIDVVNRVLRSFRRYTGDGLPGEPTNAPLPVGDPQSGNHNPDKAELRAMHLAVLTEGTEAAEQAQELLAEFSRVYLGALPADPSADNDGGPLQTGALYFNTTDGKFRVWSGTVWQNQSTGLSDGEVTEPKLALALRGKLVAIAATRTALAQFDGAAYQSVDLMEAGRKGRFYWNASNLSAQVTADTAEGIYIAPAGDPTGASGAWVRAFDGDVNIAWFGASHLSADNTAAYAAAVALLPDGSRIFWPKTDGLWTGHFVSIGKAFRLDGRGNNFRNVSGLNSSVVRMEGGIASVTTLTANATYGNRSLAVASSAGIAANDILCLEDDLKQDENPSNPKINQELIRAFSVNSGTSITVYDKVRSEQKTGTRSVQKLTPIRDVRIENFNIEVADPYNGSTGTNSTSPISVYYADGAVVRNCRVSRFWGPGITVRYSFDARIEDCGALDAAGLTSGAGYAFQFYACRSCKLLRSWARKGIRHAADLNSCYDAEIGWIDSADTLSAILITHNRSGGKIHVHDCSLMQIVGGAYGIVADTGGVADPVLHIIRDITIENIVIEFTDAHDTGTHIGVYLQTSWANVKISDIAVVLARASSVPGNNQTGVQLLGVPQGFTLISGVRASAGSNGETNFGLSWCVEVEGRTLTAGGTYPGKHDLVRIQDCYNLQGQGVVRARGVKHLSTERLTMTNAPVQAIKVVATLASIANVTNESIGVHAALA